MSALRGGLWKWKPLALAMLGIGGAACDPAASPTSDFWRPWYEQPRDDAGDPDPPPPPPPPDLAGGAVDLASADGSGPPPNCSLAISVTTTSAGGRYAPRNIGAIWISDGSERFIKTVMVWADKRARYLKRWNEVTAAAMAPASRVDAISSATKSTHGLRSAAWNCTNLAGMRVADGAYKVCFELTDYDGTGPNNCVSFVKSPTAATITPPDAPSFTARRLEFSP